MKKKKLFFTKRSSWWCWCHWDFQGQWEERENRIWAPKTKDSLNLKPPIIFFLKKVEEKLYIFYYEEIVTKT